MKNQQKTEMLLFSILSQRFFSFSERFNPTRLADGGESIGNLGEKITDVRKKKNKFFDVRITDDTHIDVIDVLMTLYNIARLSLQLPLAE